MSKIAFTRFGGQVQFEKLMVGRLDNSGARHDLWSELPNIIDRADL